MKYEHKIDVGYTGFQLSRSPAIFPRECFALLRIIHTEEKPNTQTSNRWRAFYIDQALHRVPELF